MIKEPEILLSIAKKELDLLADYSFFREGLILWPFVEMVGKDVWTSSFTNMELYNGVAGIGITFAYAASIFKNDRYQEIAKASLETLMKTLDRRQESALNNVGAFSGWGGLIYTLCLFNHLMPNVKISSYRDAILKWSAVAIDDDKILDVIGGSAGFILALFSVRKQIEPDLFFKLIQKAAQHILDHYPDPEKISMLGLSHGIAGFVLALSKANSLLQNPKIQDWIKIALAYERRYFNAEKNNWPDFRQGENVFSYAWCHGAPGIGLARLMMLEILKDSDLEKEVDAAIQATLHHDKNLYTNLCHGSLGNLDFLLEVDKRRHEKKWDIATPYINRVVKQIHQQGSFLEIAGTMPLPGLMTGRAGIAYQMMRLVFPEKVLSILSLANIEKTSIF